MSLALLFRSSLRWPCWVLPPGPSLFAETVLLVLAPQLLPRSRPLPAFLALSLQGNWILCEACQCWLHCHCLGMMQDPPPFSPLSPPTVTPCPTAFPSSAASSPSFACPPCRARAAAAPIRGVSRATLVVCPESILPQWQMEVARHLKPGALKARERGRGFSDHGFALLRAFSPAWAIHVLSPSQAYASLLSMFIGPHLRRPAQVLLLCLAQPPTPLRLSLLFRSCGNHREGPRGGRPRADHL